MGDLNFIDALYFIPITALIPILTGMYLQYPAFSDSARRWVTIMGFAWIVYVFTAEFISNEVLNVPWMDARWHWWHSLALLERINLYGWTAFFEHFGPGNAAYQCYGALIAYTGASIYTVTGINGLMTFWGGLILAWCYGSVCPFDPNKRFWLFFTIFCPSVVFWCTVNLKEAFMYWSICNMVAIGFPQKGFSAFVRMPIIVASIALGTLMRIHVMIGWVAAAGVAGILQKRRRMGAIVVLACMPLVALNFQKTLQLDFNQEVLIAMGEGQSRTLANVGGQGSKIHLEGSNPVFLVSGVIAGFLRPFPWEIKSLRLAVQSLEVWTTTYLIVYAWFMLGRRERGYAVMLPGIHIAILGSLWMCLLLTYFPNEGLVARQRVQMVPGLLTLCIVPLVIRDYAEAWKASVRHRYLMAKAGSKLTAA